MSDLNFDLDLSDHDLDDIDMEAVRYKPPGLQQLCCSTKFTRNELRIMYRGFKQVSEVVVSFRNGFVSSQ